MTGAGGSGTIFLTGCTLRCSFCQNWQISRAGMGAPADEELFADICLALQDAGAENVNIVTGSHAVPSVAVGLARAKERGLAIPALWNSSAYETVEAVDLAGEWMDAYLPDLKTLDTGISRRFFAAPDYPEFAAASILRMAERRPLRFMPSRVDPEVEVLASGVIVRHLVLPGMLDSTRDVLCWFADHLAGRALLSLMNQYAPVRGDPSLAIPSDRPVDEREFDAVQEMLQEFGIEEGFYQELVPGDDWLPDFERTNPFSSELSVPIWHWKTGFAASGGRSSFTKPV